MYNLGPHLASAIKPYLQMKVFFTLLLGAFALGLSAQGYDARLLAKYSDVQIKKLQQTHPEIIAYWTYYLDHGYEVIEIPIGKGEVLWQEIKMPSRKSFNILSSGLVSDRLSPKYYRIAGTNKLLMLLSGEEVARRFNQHSKN
jgi:hypothetical protein